MRQEERGDEGGVAQSAYSLRDRAAGLFTAARNFATATGDEDGSGSELSESDAVLIAKSLPESQISRVLDFSEDDETDRGGGGGGGGRRALRYRATARDMLPGVQAPGAHAEVFVREQRTIRVKNANNEPRHLYGMEAT